MLSGETTSQRRSAGFLYSSVPSLTCSPFSDGWRFRCTTAARNPSTSFWLVLRFLSERSLDAEHALQYDLLQSEQKYRDLIENAVDPIFEIDADLRYVDVNRKATELTGFTKEELLRRTIHDMVPPDQLRLSAAAFDKLRQCGAYEKFEGKLRTKDGHWIDVEVNSSAVIRGGKVVGSQNFVRKITDRKQCQEGGTETVSYGT